MIFHILAMAILGIIFGFLLRKYFDFKKILDKWIANKVSLDNKENRIYWNLKWIGYFVFFHLPVTCLALIGLLYLPLVFLVKKSRNIFDLPPIENTSDDIGFGVCLALELIVCILYHLYLKKRKESARHE